VAVHVTDPLGETHTIRARTAVVTLPVGVLRRAVDETRVVFEPELPAAKRGALEHMRWGTRQSASVVSHGLLGAASHGRYRDGAFRRRRPRSRRFWTQFPVRSELVAAWAGGPKARL